MTFRRLILESLRHRWRSHCGVLLGATVGAAILIGALAVGDSVRGTLRDLGLRRLAGAHLAMSPADRYYRQELFSGLEAGHTLAGHVSRSTGVDPASLELSAPTVSALHLPGTAARQDRTARANRIHVYGVPVGMYFQPAAPDASPDALAGGLEAEVRANPPPGTVILNRALAGQLNAKAGDEIVVRIHKPGVLSTDAVIAPRDDQSTALRLRVLSVAGAAEGGDLSLSPSQVPPLNAFVRLDELDQAAGLQGRVNLTLIPGFFAREAPRLRLRDLWVRLRLALHLAGTGQEEPSARAWEKDATLAPLLNAALGHLWDLPDAELALRPCQEGIRGWELHSRRIFLDDAVVEAALRPMATNRWRPEQGLVPAATVTNGVGLLTYLVNELRAGTNATPYSMVTAADAPWVPADLAEDEMLVNEWLAADLGVGPGDTVQIAYYLPDTGTQLMERTNRFRVRGVVPIAGPYADRSVMPEFPGLTHAESTRDWDAGFKLVHPIRDKDEAYWKKYRGTPKAFIRLAAGQRLWSNRFGRLTSIRFPATSSGDSASDAEGIRATVLSNLSPAAVGLRVEAVRDQALRAAAEGQDFGELFIGFSFFLILSALILTGMLFAFGVEQRREEVGTLLAFGFTPRRVRWLFGCEGLGVACLGTGIGAGLGMLYARSMLWALATLWRDAVGTSSLELHVSAGTLLGGAVGAVGISGLALALVLRRQASRPARELLSGEEPGPGAQRRPGSSRALWRVAIGSLGGAAAIAVGAALGSDRPSPQAFFGAGALGLCGGLAGAALGLSHLAGSGAPRRISSLHLALGGLGRRRSRSLATIALLASGTFLVVSIGVNRLDAVRGADRRDSGTGGFALIGESALPVAQDLNTRTGRESLGLDESLLSGVTAVPFRVRAGDDASCLNLNRAQRPRLLGVDPQALEHRNAFRFAAAMRGADPGRGWSLLQRGPGMAPDEIPAIGDAASIQWALHRSLGDVLTYADDQGREFRVKLVAGLANSVLQGSLVIDEKEFLRRFPGTAGHQFFLVEAPAGRAAAVSAELSRALQNLGFEALPATTRLAQYNAVQNTYLGTFQLLGGLGLLLGSAGLGVVVLRNALERRGELALLLAVGFRAGRVHHLMFFEHATLMLAGLGVGIGAAMVAVAPALLQPDHAIPVRMLTGMLAAVFTLGLVSTWLATRAALQGDVLKNLRTE
jgi:ABC-type lipoprotein release transport system permease subunit